MSRRCLPSLKTTSHSWWGSSGLYNAKAPSCLFKTYRANADCTTAAQTAESSYPTLHVPERHWSCPNSRYNSPERRPVAPTSDCYSRSTCICTDCQCFTVRNSGKLTPAAQTFDPVFQQVFRCFRIWEGERLSARKYNECESRSLHSPCFRVKVIIAVTARKQTDEEMLTQKNCYSVLHIR